MCLKRVLTLTTTCLTMACMATPTSNNTQAPDSSAAPQATAAAAATANETGKPSQAEVSAQNKLGWTLYQAQAVTKENIFLSPSSVYLALALTYEGSQGPVRQEAQKFLGLPQKPGPLHPPLVDHLKKLEKSKDIQLIMGNAIWTDQKAEGMTAPTKEFQAIAKDVYNSELGSASFTPPKKVVDQINTWAGKQTKGLIKQIVTEADLVGQTVAILNAIYFKGFWDAKFDKTNTSSGKFFAEGGELVRPFMDQTRQFGYYENDEAQIVNLPYQGGELAMTIVLPKEGKKLDDLEDSLSADKLTSWFQNLKNERVHIRLPKFEIKWGVKDLRGDLVKAGMPVGGDFTPLGSPDLQVGHVLHKTVIKVDEQGSEAAAVTAVTMRFVMVSEPKQFIVNRPFFFVIRDVSQGHWLFMGRVLRP